MYALYVCLICARLQVTAVLNNMFNLHALYVLILTCTPSYVLLICTPYMYVLTGDSGAQHHVRSPRLICPYPYMHAFIVLLIYKDNVPNKALSLSLSLTHTHTHTHPHTAGVKGAAKVDLI